MGVPEQRIQELRELLLRWQHAYYVLGKPEVSDSEYDTLFNELLTLETRYPDLQSPSSPTLRVGSDLTTDLPEVEHTIPVLSLDKRYSSEAVVAWIEKLEKDLGEPVEVVAEEKLDGVSIVLYYEKGVLQRGVTRGNGYRGNDITNNIKTIGSIPLVLSKPITVAVRGEIYIPISEFSSLEGDVEYANPRNLAAGTIRRKQSSSVAKMPLRIFVYEGFSTDLPGDHEAILQELITLGFPVNRWKTFSSHKDLSEVDPYLSDLAKERSSLDYEVDGVVFKVASVSVREKLGYTGHHPRWAMAWKFEAPEAETTVESIDIQVGRSGRVTPVARVAPTQVGGTTVSNITLHNQDYIDMLDVSIGDHVAISRRGDVIPAVERVIESSGNPLWHLPKDCPQCGTALEQRGAHTFCPNYHCPAQVYGRIIFFVGRDQMDIDGLGSQTIRTLIDEGFITDLPDLYTVDWERFAELPGFGEKKVTHIKKSLEESKEKPFDKVLASLGLPDIGTKMVELLVDNGYTSIDTLFALTYDDLERLTAIKGLGEKSAMSLIDELSRNENRAIIESLRSIGLQFALTESTDTPTLPQIFADQSWCITGSFEQYNPRSLAGVEIKKRGGKVVSSVSGKTTHLLAGVGAGSKLSKAESLGVVVISEEQFIELLR